MPATKVVLSTTPSLAGWKVTAHLDVVTSHVVAGTNIFRDLAASVSDVFGGRSKSYQNQLAEINKEALQLLSSRALAIGAQGVIGLRIDVSEISGQGKGMLMVAASGTAVLAEVVDDEAREAAIRMGNYARDLNGGQWKCRCGQLNSGEDHTCPNCGRVPHAIV